MRGVEPARERRALRTKLIRLRGNDPTAYCHELELTQKNVCGCTLEFGLRCACLRLCEAQLFHRADLRRAQLLAVACLLRRPLRCPLDAALGMEPSLLIERGGMRGAKIVLRAAVLRALRLGSGGQLGLRQVALLLRVAKSVPKELALILEGHAQALDGHLRRRTQRRAGPRARICELRVRCARRSRSELLEDLNRRVAIGERGSCGDELAARRVALASLHRFLLSTSGVAAALAAPLREQAPCHKSTRSLASSCTLRAGGSAPQAPSFCGMAPRLPLPQTNAQRRALASRARNLAKRRERRGRRDARCCADDARRSRINRPRRNRYGCGDADTNNGGE